MRYSWSHARAIQRRELMRLSCSYDNQYSTITAISLFRQSYPQTLSVLLAILRRGIWSDASGQPGNLRYKGDQAPGVEEGSVFNEFNSIFSPEMNASGQVAFRARLSSPNNEIHNTYGIWATDVNGEIQLIARQGDLFDVNDDPLIEDLPDNLFYRHAFYGLRGRCQRHTRQLQ